MFDCIDKGIFLTRGFTSIQVPPPPKKKSLFIKNTLNVKTNFLKFPVVVKNQLKFRKLVLVLTGKMPMSDGIIIIFLNNSPQIGVIVHWIYSKAEILEIIGLSWDEKKKRFVTKAMIMYKLVMHMDYQSWVLSIKLYWFV